MIASFSRDFIFIKTRKTGGTSIEIALSQWLSSSDVCTPISKDDEGMRKDVLTVEPMAKFNGARLRNHMPASEVRTIFPDLWKTAFKFTIERHPYEKAVSLAFHSAAKRDISFETSLDRVVQGAEYVDRDIYRIDNEIAVDQVIKYEKLKEELNEIASRLGCTPPGTLSNAKGNYRKDRRPAELILSPAQRRQIQLDSSMEFESFGFAP